MSRQLSNLASRPPKKTTLLSLNSIHCFPAVQSQRNSLSHPNTQGPNATYDRMNGIGWVVAQKLVYGFDSIVELGSTHNSPRSGR